MGETFPVDMLEMLLFLQLFSFLPISLITLPNLRFVLLLKFTLSGEEIKEAERELQWIDER